MTLDPDSPAEYLIGHIEDALARDPRVAEQGLRAALVGDPPTVVITGTVASAARRAAVAAVVAELLPGAPLRDRTTAADYPESGQVEQVP